MNELDLEYEELEQVDAEGDFEGEDERQQNAALIQQLEELKEEAVHHKIEIEQKWIQDERQYWGFRQVDQDENTDEDYDLPPVDNKTAEKVELAASRIGDMLFPTNDPNWTLKQTPVPTDIDGQPVEPEQAKKAVKDASKVIEDYLNECQYAKHGRHAIHDACRLGVGVLKGPYPRMTSRRVMRRSHEPALDEYGQPAVDELGQAVTEAVMQIQIEQETSPATTRVDPWMFFALPCRSMEESEGVFEMHNYGRSRIVQLAQHEGFDRDAVAELATMSPSHSEYESSLLNEREHLLRHSDNSYDENEYVVWEYHGPIEPELLRRLGKLDQCAEDDPLEMYWGEVWFSQGVPLKVEINAIMGDERVPYYVIPYRRDESDIMNSYGVPRIMRDDQRTIDISWEAMLHNVKLTSGPQTVYWQGRAMPTDGSYVVKGPKTWRVTDDRVKSINDVIQFSNIESALPNILPLYEAAKQNASDSTQMPQLAHGEASNTTQQTASGLQMIMNSQNIVQRKFAHAWDDEVTVPMLTRYYWWMLQYHDDESLKIDMKVDPRGASYLLVKDKQAQHSMMALTLAQNDPELKSELKMTRMYRLVFSTMDIPVSDLFKTDEEKEQEGPSPAEQMQQQQMQLELQKLEGEAQKVAAEAQEVNMRMETMQQNGGVDPADLIELQREQMRAETAMQEMETKLLIAQMDRDSKIAAAAAQENVKIADIEARFQTSEQDRQIRASLDAAKLEHEKARERADEVFKGMEMRLKLAQEKGKQENMDAGYDSYG